ncbi:MAG: ATP-dependent helicase RecG [Clostridium butyricum]|nr:ATP-dependent helicase RecG [Clostridium butyricum]
MRKFNDINTKLYSGGTPTFDEGDIFKITIPLKNIATAKVGPDSKSVGQNVGEDVGQSVGQDEVKLQELIIKLISENNKITKKQIAKVALVSEKTVERQMKKMTNVKYVGRGYSGHWEIISRKK